MTTSSGKMYPSGTRYGVVFELNTNGRIKGTSGTVPYTGLRFIGQKAFSVSIPKQRQIFHIDADRVGAADFLPPTSTATAQINVSADDFELDTLLTGNKQVVIGEADTIASLTSNQGYEPIIACMFFQQAIDHVSRLRAWRSFLIPRAKAVPMYAGMGDKEIDGQFDVMMIPSTTNILGVSLSESIDGATDAQLFRAMTQGRPAIAAWTGNGYTQDFNLEQPSGTAAPALSTAKIAVYKNGTKLSAGFTSTVNKVTFTVAPLITDDICIFWEF